MIIRNYIKIAIRVIRKNKLYSGLNIFGLAIGIASSIFILQYISFEKSFDTFHANYENLYRVQYKVLQEGVLKTNSATAVPRVGPFMKEQLPAVKEFARAYPVFGVVKKDELKYRENKVYFADQSFLTIFDFPTLHGNADLAFSEPNSLVITESIANKYFGRTDVVGERLAFSSWFQVNGEVKAVLKDIPTIV